MADHQQIIEQIRGFLQASDQTRNERLESMALAYSEACAEVNQRLGRCQRLLQQGLRSEAIQLAEAEPRLLDAFETLNFPERVEWDDLVEIYSLGAAPKLMVEARGALSEAYAEAEPLQDLLKTHRRLATQRAALRTRIGVMRKLMNQDARNPIWAEDLRTFEKARMRQIQIEAAEALRLHDTAHVTRLLSELQESNWIEAPPKSLVQGLSKAGAQLRGDQARTARAEIEARLSDALANKDSIRGRTARDEWNTLSASVPLEPGDPCWERVAPVLTWLEDEDRKAVAAQAYEAGLAALTSALDSRRAMSAGELERLERDVLRHGRGMPEKLQRRYDARFRAAATTRSRRSRMIVAAAILVLAGAGGAALFWIWGSGRARDVQEAAVRITGFLESGDCEHAEGYLDDLEKADPSLASDPILKKARQQSKTARKQDIERATKFEAALQEAESSPPEDFEPKALKEARDLARRESEHAAVAELTRKREAARKEAADKRNSSLRPRLDTIIRDIDQFEKRLIDASFDQSSFQEELDSSRRSLDELAPSIAEAGQEFQRRARDAKQKLETVLTSFNKLNRQTLLKDEITSAVAYSVTQPADNLSLFGSRLREFVRLFPDVPCTAAFEKTLTERPLWDAVGAWNALVSRLKNQHGGLTAKEASLRDKECGEFLENYPEFPGIPDVREYRRFMQAIARRNAGANSPAQEIVKLFSKPLLGKLYMVVVDDGDGREVKNRYYTRELPVEKDKFVWFNPIIESGDAGPRRSFQANQVLSRNPAPQSRLVERLKPIVSDPATLERWDSVMIELIRVILNERELDPVLQAILLKNVAKAAADGSEPVRVALEFMIKQFEQSRVDLNVDWTNPAARNLAASQEGARALIDKLRSKMPTIDQVKSVRDRLELTFRQTYPTTGWLIRDREGYEVKTGAAQAADGDLQIVVPTAEKRAEWKKIGEIKAGKWSLKTTENSDLVEGRPVFVIDRSP
jgi:hypothetical protein